VKQNFCNTRKNEVMAGRKESTQPKTALKRLNFKIIF